MTEIEAEGLGYLCGQAQHQRRAFIPEIEASATLLDAFARGYDTGAADLARGVRSTPEGP